MSWIEVVVGGMKHRVAIVRAGEGGWVAWRGMVRYLGAEQEFSRGSQTVERDVRAPMTGRVIKVAAKAGSPVRLNEVLVILEAMKMEYRLVSPRDGTVVSVECKEGDRVDLGRVLVTLAP